MSVNEPPALVLVQASSRSWEGGEDFCLREFAGAPAVAHTLASIRRHFPDTPIRLIAPEFDRGGRLSDIAHSIDGDVRTLYGFDASPLDRMLMAIEGQPDEAMVLRVDGLHFAADFRLATEMLSHARERRLDGVKTPDDFPPQLSVDVLRVGGLRRARALLDDDASPFLIHPKFLLAHDPTFAFEHYEDLPIYSDDHLTMVRGIAKEMLSEVERLEVGGRGACSQGNQLTYHYELALRHLGPDDRVLDVACGDGFGVRMIAPHCAATVGVDLDEPTIAAAQAGSGEHSETYVVADAMDMPFEDGAFDVVASFETLEHVPPEPFLSEVHRVLAPGGRLLLSTPQNRLGHIPLTPAHLREFSLDELTELLSAHFEILERIGLKAGTIWFPGDPVGSNSFFVCRRP